MKKPFESKAKRLYSIFASMFFMLAVFVVPAFAADGDPLAVVNNLSDFIFSLIRAVGLILQGDPDADHRLRNAAGMAAPFPRHRSYDVVLSRILR